MAAKIFDESRTELASLMKENVDLVADKLIRLDGKVDDKFSKIGGQIVVLDSTLREVNNDLVAVIGRFDSKLKRDEADAEKRDRRWRWVAGIGGTVCAGVTVDLARAIFPNI